MSSSSSNSCTPCSSSQSQEENNASVGDDGRLPMSNYPLISRDDLILGEPLGAGAYGSVYRGTWKTGSKEVSVAIKKVFMLEKEADILSKVRHRNIIQFFGVSHTNLDFFIVTEFAENGSLYDYVHKECSNEIEFVQILTWAIQIAQGVGYLHYEAPETIIHRDLKSKNVVLSGELVCKLCDFGTSKNLTHSCTAPSWGGTAAWMSPEIINQKEGITIATDVWSYGVVLWEMIAREIPYKGLTEFSIYSMIAQQGVTLVIPEECPLALSELMKNCWKVNPKDRYDMKQVLSALDCIKEDSEFTEQCGVFLKHKENWKCEIYKQLKQLVDEKIDYVKKMEELSKWERALKRREESQRELLENDSLVFDGDVTLWDELHVCNWIRKISAAIPLNGDLLDHLVALIIHHNISGRRLLDITPKDLEYLGICSLGPRVKLYREIQNLRKENHRMRNFPTLEVSQQQLDQQKRNDKIIQPLCFSLVLHVTMYTRQSGFDYLPKFRYKIVVDTDWEDAYLSDDLPDDLRNAHSIVKDVCISLIYDDKTPLCEPFRCIRGPFVVSDWIDSPLSGGGVRIVCAVSYTDRVIRPRSTCIRTKIFDFSRPQTLESKKIDLVIRTSTTLSPCKTPFPINERSKPSLSSDSGVSLSNSLQGAWRNRIGGELSATEISDALSTATPQSSQSKSPLWADIAAGLRGTFSPVSHTPALRSTSVQLCNNDLQSLEVSNDPILKSDSRTLNISPSSPSLSSYLSPNVKPLDSKLGQFFSAETVVRDVPQALRSSFNVHRCSTADQNGKCLRYHFRQQAAIVTRRSGNNRIRRRPLPILLPRRKPSVFAQEGDIVPQIQVQGDSVISSKLDFDASPGFNCHFSKLSIDGMDNCKPIDSVTNEDPIKHDPAIVQECGKKKRRRRRRPHRRSNTANHDQNQPITNIQHRDLNSKQNHEYVHGGCNKWSWKINKREPE